MAKSMNRKLNKLTKWSLLIVWWVIAICLAKNIGLLDSYAVKYSSEQHSMQLVKTPAQGFGEKCHLSEHLVNFEHCQVQHYAILTQVFTLGLILWLLSTPVRQLNFTEPIFRKRRRLHLKLCIFRE